MAFQPYLTFLYFGFCRFLPALGIFALNFSIPLIVETEAAARFISGYVVLAILSVIATFGSDIYILRSESKRTEDRIFEIDDKFTIGVLNVLIRSAIMLPFVFIIVFEYNFSTVVYFYPFQAIINISSSFIKHERPNLGAFFEYGTASTICLMLILINNNGSLELFLLTGLILNLMALLVLIYRRENTKSYLISDVGVNSSVGLWARSKEQRILARPFGINSLVAMLSTWLLLIVVDIVSTPDIVILLNNSLRLISLASFIIATLDIYFLRTSSRIYEYQDRMIYFKELSRRFTYTFIISMVVFLVLAVIIHQTQSFYFINNSLVKYNLSLFFLVTCSLPYLAYFLTGPSGITLFSLGREKMNNIVSILILVLQCLLILACYINVSDLYLFPFVAASVFYGALAIKFVIYRIITGRLW